MPDRPIHHIRTGPSHTFDDAMPAILDGGIVALNILVSSVFYFLRCST